MSSFMRMLVGGRSQWGQDAAIDEALGDARDAIALSGDLAGQIGKLFRLVTAQSQEIKRLQIALDVAIHMLGEKGAIDPGVFPYRLEAAITEAFPPAEPEAEPAPGDDPYRGEKAPSAAPARLTTCVQCLKQVPASTTTVTERGELCDACYQARP